MEIQDSAFYSTAIKLTWLDLLKLLFGKEIKESSYIIALDRMPDNGCPHCRALNK